MYNIISMEKRPKFCDLMEDKSTFEDTDINDMPDEILHHILSFLNIDEALRTSVLSRRWRYAWTFQRVLDFHAIQTRNDGDLMNHIVTCHRGTVDALRAPTFPQNIDSWIRFAIQKRVRRLHLYRLLFTIKDERAILQLHPNDVSKCRFLRSLCLESIDIDGELLECFLTQCRFLERVLVLSSVTLTDFKIAGPQLKLKYLYIVHCPRLKSIAIYAHTRDLVTFSIQAACCQKLHLEYAPKISGLRLKIDHRYQNVLTSPISRRYVLQLHALHFDCNCLSSVSSKDFPIFGSLKHLVMTLSCFNCWRLSHLIQLLEAAPVLNKLTLKMFVPCERVFQNIKREYWPAAGADGAPSHQCLRVLEAIDFRGTVDYIELILYLFNSIATLCKLVIYPHLCMEASLEKMEDCTEEEISWPIRRYSHPRESKTYRQTIEKALELKAMLPPGIEFVLVE